MRAALLVAMVGATTRPAVLRPSFVLETESAAPGVTLGDQREVAEGLRPYLEGRRIAVLGNSEILVLLRRTNDLPFAVWAAGNHSYYGRPGESSRDTWERLVGRLDPDVIVPGGYVPMPPEQDYREVRVESSNGRYAVTAFFSKVAGE